MVPLSNRHRLTPRNRVHDFGSMLPLKRSKCVTRRESWIFGHSIRVSILASRLRESGNPRDNGTSSKPNSARDLLIQGCAERERERLVHYLVSLDPAGLKRVSAQYQSDHYSIQLASRWAQAPARIYPSIHHRPEYSSHDTGERKIQDESAPRLA